VDVALNWLTQGVIVAVATALGLRVIPSSHTQARYVFVWIAYLVVLCLPALSLVLAATIDAPAAETVSIRSGMVAIPVAWWSSPVAAISLWSIWLAIHAVHFFAGVVVVLNARRQSRECPADVLAQLPHWPYLNQTGRPTRVVLSDRVRLAAVLGCGSPIIALAPRVVAELGVADLDRVLTHEWAHIQRRDDVAQVVQRLVRIIVGWHPAAWWLERQLEFEREVACDELAVRVTGSAKAYAACLTTLAALPQAAIRPVPALAVSPSRLRRRLVRILTGSVGATVRPWRAVAVGGGVGLLAFALAVGNVNIATSAVKSAGVSTAARLVSDAASGINLLEQPRSAPPVARQFRTSARDTHESRISVRPASPENTASEASQQVRDMRGIEANTRTIDEPATVATAPTPLPSSNSGLDWQLSTPVAPLSPERADEAAGVTTPPDDSAQTPWSVAADSGVAIGRASRTAGVGTAGFFSRVGKKIAGSF
jgi:beta-lactamase regulating signal transducer with metallopeptidase domain